MFAMARSLVSCRRAAAAVEDVASRAGVARIEPTTGLQTSQPRPEPRRAMISSNEVSSSTRTDSNSSWRRELEVLAQGARERDARLRQLGLEQLLDERHARPALGAGAGAGLQRAELGAAVGVLVAVHGVADRAGADVVAGADERVVGQLVAGRRLHARRREVGGRARSTARVPSSGRSEAYGEASPTKMPPSRVFASSVMTSFWYRPRAGSA